MPFHDALTGAAAVHPAAYYQSADPGAVGAGKFWLNTTSGPPWPLTVRNAGNTGWESVGNASAFQWATKTANYTITATDSGILVDATSGNVTITLLSAVGVEVFYAIKRIDSSGHTVTIATTSAQTIDGNATITLALAAQGIVVGSNNANWDILAAFTPNPMTSQDDIIIGGASGSPTRLAKGPGGTLLRIDPVSGHVTWEGQAIAAGALMSAASLYL